MERFKVHAPEYMQDDNGQWYITTCGWAGISSIPQARQAVEIAKLNFASAVPTNGRQAWYPLDQATVVTDTSGNGNDGTLVDETWPMSGVIGSALRIAGTGYMAVGPLPMTGDFTIDGIPVTWKTPTNTDGLFVTNERYDLNLFDARPRFFNGLGDVLVSSTPMVAGHAAHIALKRQNGQISLYMTAARWRRERSPTRSPSQALACPLMGTLNGGIMKSISTIARWPTRKSVSSPRCRRPRTA